MFTPRKNIEANGTNNPLNASVQVHQLEEYYVHGRKRVITTIGLALVLFISALDSTIGERSLLSTLTPSLTAGHDLD